MEKQLYQYVYTLFKLLEDVSVEKHFPIWRVHITELLFSVSAGELTIILAEKDLPMSNHKVALMLKHLPEIAGQRLGVTATWANAYTLKCQSVEWSGVAPADAAA